MTRGGRPFWKAAAILAAFLGTLGESGRATASDSGPAPDLFAAPRDEFYGEGRPGDYRFGDSVNHVASIPLVTSGVFAATVAIGLIDWEWGSEEFSFVDEGFFGLDTYNGGMDKLGHSFGTFLLSDVFTDAIRLRADNPEHAEITGAALSMGVMTAVEIFDGFSGHGFAWQDMVMNSAGAGLSYLRNTVPGMRDKIDFRLEYLPSGHDDEYFKPHSDYAGQKYLLALKLAGFDALEETPLRFLELQAGYYARGFTISERREGEERRREPYVGVGLNVGELLFGWPSVRDTAFGRIGRYPTQYVQVPYTYAAHPYD